MQGIITSAADGHESMGNSAILRMVAVGMDCKGQEGEG